MIQDAYVHLHQHNCQSEFERLAGVIIELQPLRLRWRKPVAKAMPHYVAELGSLARSAEPNQCDVLLCNRIIIFAHSAEIDHRCMYQGYMAFRRLDGVTAKSRESSDIDNKRNKLRVSQLRITQEMLDDCFVERDPFDVSSKTDQEIVDEANGLAAQFYKAHGYEVPEGYKFHEATHPHEISMWNMAVLAYEYLTGTDLNDALSGIEDEEDDQ